MTKPNISWNTLKQLAPEALRYQARYKINYPFLISVDGYSFQVIIINMRHQTKWMKFQYVEN